MNTLCTYEKEKLEKMKRWKSSAKREKYAWQNRPNERRCAECAEHRMAFVAFEVLKKWPRESWRMAELQLRIWPCGTQRKRQVAARVPRSSGSTKKW